MTDSRAADVTAPVTIRGDSVTMGHMHSNGNSFGSKETEQECPLIRRILAVAEDRR